MIKKIEFPNSRVLHRTLGGRNIFRYARQTGAKIRNLPVNNCKKIKDKFSVFTDFCQSPGNVPTKMPSILENYCDQTVFSRVVRSSQMKA